MNKKICSRCQFPNDKNSTYCVHCHLSFKRDRKIKMSLTSIAVSFLAFLIFIFQKHDVNFKSSNNNDVENYKYSVSEIINIVRAIDKQDTVTYFFPDNEFIDANGYIIGTEYKAPVKGYIKVKVDNSIEFKIYDGTICGVKKFDEPDAILTYGECETYNVD